MRSVNLLLGLTIVLAFTSVYGWTINHQTYLQDRADSFEDADHQQFLIEELTAKRNILVAKNAIKPVAISQSIEDSTYTAIPALEQVLGSSVYGAFDAAVKGDLAVTAFEGFARLPQPNTYPLFVTYSGLKNKTLTKVDAVYQNYTWGSAAGSVCDHPTKHFVMEALIRAKTPGMEPFISPIDILVVIWEYYPNGTWYDAPTTIYNLSTAEPDIYQKAASYSGAAEFSEDCEYLVYTAAIGANTPFPFTPTKQVLGLLKIDENLQLTRVASIDFPATGVAGWMTIPPFLPLGQYLYFAQTAYMNKNKRTGLYNLVVPAPVYTFMDIWGAINGTAAVFSYTFDESTGTLAQVSQIPLNQYPQGLAVSNDERDVVIITDCAFKDVPAFSKRCKSAYNNGVIDGDNELRFYSLDRDAQLKYKNSIELNGWGVKAAFSKGDDQLAVTWAPALINTFLNVSALSGFSFSSSVVSIYEYKGNRITSDDLIGNAGTSPLNFGIDYTDDDLLFLAGQPMLLQYDVQLIDTKPNKN